MPTTIARMGKKKSPSAADRHKPGFMVRIPERLGVQLDILCEQHVTTRTTEVVAAVREYLESKGLWPPKQDQVSH